MLPHDLRSLARALGGEVNGGQVLCPGPGHSVKDRSLSVKLDAKAPDGFLVNSFADDDPLTCRDYVRQKCGLAPFKPHASNGGRRFTFSNKPKPAAKPDTPDQDDNIEARRKQVERQEKRSAIHAAQTRARAAEKRVAKEEHRQAAFVQDKPEVSPGKKLVATYDYTDNGVLLYQVLKYDPKGFAQRRPDGNGGWTWSVKGCRRVLYRLADLLKYPDATVFVTEGEKDSDRVVSLGYCAVTVACGDWTKDCIEALRGRDVVILEDADVAGVKKATKAATLLQDIAKSVRKVRLPGQEVTTERDGKDVSDWLNDDPKNADRFAEVCLAVPLWTPPVEDDQGAKDAKHFTLTRFDQIAFEPSVAYLVDNIVPTGGLVVVWGPPKCGKSFWVFDLSMHIALGWLYRERKVEQGAVVYLALEGGKAFRNRVAAFKQRHAVNDAPFYLITDRTNLITDHPALIEDIRAQVAQGEKPAVVVIDTLNRSLAGSESRDEDMAAYLKAADAIREAFGCTVIIIHHCGVDGTRPRGHTSLTGAADAQLAVTRDEADNVLVEIEWLKDGAEDDTAIISRLEPIEVGRNKHGAPITSCVVVPEIARTADDGKPRRKLSDKQRLAIDALTEVTLSHGQDAPREYQLPRDVKTVAADQWKEELYRRNVLERDGGNPRARYNELRDRLTRYALVGSRDNLVWLVRPPRQT
jgi:hypothetical protein